MINPPPPFPPSGEAYEKSVGARILITLGAVWLFLTGGCTLAVSGSYILDGAPSYGFGFLIVFAVFGLVCMLPGIICLIVGLVLARRARRMRRRG
ncbi:MAG: hypothetical protein JWR84_1215 [Caulobacter sp.]|nr:hypothetical protein [Caulobacter sp.]